MYIYKTTNLINGIIYIGKSEKSDPEYLGSGLCLTRAIKKYGRKNFNAVIIDYASDLEDLNNKEKFWIKFYNARNFSVGYNIAEGGDGTGAGENAIWYGRKHTKETKEKIRIANSGENCYMYGKSHSKESKELMRLSHIGEKAAMYGKHHTEKAKEKIRLSKIGKHLPEETKNKIGIANKGKFRSDETKDRMRKAMTGKHLSEETKEKIRRNKKEYWKNKKMGVPT